MNTSFFDGKRILVTGACGTVGSELVKQLLHSPDHHPIEVIGLDNSESELFFLDQHYLMDQRARFFVADIRKYKDLIEKFQGVDIVFHCAALKHVVLCERSPEQAIQTNIDGVQNVIAASRDAGVGLTIFTSSDKAVNPTNVMGTSKLMGERLMTAANSNQRDTVNIFASTRFGNVLGSSGSVIPIFYNQIAKGGPVTLTHKEMTRFVMSIKDSVRLVLASAQQAKGGEVFITKMPVVKVVDLAHAMIAELAPKYGYEPEEIEIVEIGTKPGEKLYEELMSEEETRRAVELESYFSVLPAFRGLYREIDYSYESQVTDTVNNPYNSSLESALDVSSIRRLLNSYDLLSMPNSTTDQRYWPGDKESFEDSGSN
ncbi:polysaccharide biosynthesis protein [Amylibacter sp.]|nr:polysaccharide biosynthesis protein [Amylibacter sp.]